MVFLYGLAIASWHPNSYGRAIWRSPSVHLAFEVYEALFDLPTVHLALEYPLSEAQQERLHLVDPSFRAPPVPGLELPATHAKNVLIVVLESTGAEYVQDIAAGQPDPMQYLRHLGQQGLMLSQHHSTANTSHRSVYSILSGLYPSTQRTSFCTRNDIELPALPTWMGPETDAFLYTPGRMQSFFPKGFLRNNGFELVGYDELGDMGIPRWAANGRDERISVQAFIDRMSRAREPFVGVYYSYVPHFWYQDQGPEWRLLPDIKQRKNKYINGLFMMDHLVARMVWALHEQGRDDSTLVVVTGDHGEAFGQHAGNVAHSRFLYEEDIKVPAVIVGPGIPVGRIEAPTSHVDLLPTLLDAMGHPWERARLQGESLFRESDRKQIFAVGSENAIVAIDRERRKVRVSYSTDRCTAWNLPTDPGEQAKLDCSEFGDLEQSIADFHGFQAAALVKANAAIP